MVWLNLNDKFLPLSAPAGVNSNQDWLIFKDENNVEQTIIFDKNPNISWSYVTDPNDGKLYLKSSEPIIALDPKAAPIPPQPPKLLNLTANPSHQEVISATVLGPDQSAYFFDNNYLTKLDSKGNVLWRYSKQSNGGTLFIRGWYSPFTVDSNNMIYLIDYNGIQAVNPDGTQKWKSTWSSVSPDSTYLSSVGRPIVSLDKKKLFVFIPTSGTTFPSIISYDINTGAFLGVLTQLSNNGTVMYSNSVPVLATTMTMDSKGNLIVTVSGNNSSTTVTQQCATVYSVNSITGAINWTYSTSALWSGAAATSSTNYPYYIYSPLLDSSDNIYFYVCGNQITSVVSLNPNGGTRWVSNISNGWLSTEFKNFAVLNDGTFAFLTDSQGLSAIKDGSIVWNRTDLAGTYRNFGAVSSDGTNFYIGGDQNGGIIHVIDSTGKDAWTFDPQPVSLDGAKYSSENRIAIANDGTVYATLASQSNSAGSLFIISPSIAPPAPVPNIFSRSIFGTDKINNIGKGGIVGSVKVLDGRTPNGVAHDPDSITTFTLSNIPSTDGAVVNINSIIYKLEDAFDINGNQLEWKFSTNNNGFNIKHDWDLNISYKSTT